MLGLIKTEIAKDPVIANREAELIKGIASASWNALDVAALVEVFNFI